jgi:hypothetical protein
MQVGWYPEGKDNMWTKSRFANYETEGAVRERVNKALAEGEQRRLAKTARGSQNMGLFGRVLANFGAGLAWLAARAKTGRLAARSAVETAPATSSEPSVNLR